MPAIQLRDVPADLHERLCRRAAAEHVSVSAYVLRVLERDVGRASTGAWLAGLTSREPVREADVSAALEQSRRSRERQAARVLRY